jgi:AraC-like DNA-binding protein
MDTIFRTEDLPAAERFSGWAEVTAKTHVPTVFSSDHASDFRATLGLMDLGSVQVSALVHSPLESQRTPKLIRQSDPELYHLGFLRRGNGRFSQAGRDVVIGRHDLVLYDTSRPFRSQTDSEGSTSAEVIMHMPKALLPLPSNMVDRLIARPLPGDEGIGALLVGAINHLVVDRGRFKPADAIRVGTVLLDLLTSLLTRELDATAGVPPETHRAALAMEVRAFIERRLGDPLLSPSMIADAHRISVRLLQRIFQQDGLTVAAWIRHRRLDRCRRDLADPMLGSRPVHAIAARWGFPHAQHFSRAFRTAYGMPPQDYRRMALCGRR